MPVYGPRAPTIVAQGGSPLWINTGNIFTTNGAYTTVNLTNQEITQLQLTGYGFSIGAGETLVGIKLVFVGLASTTGVTVRFALSKSAAVFSDEYPQVVTKSPATYEFGGTNDTMGYLGSVTDINAASFGAHIFGSPFELFTTTVSADSLHITVFTSSASQVFRRHRSFRGG